MSGNSDKFSMQSVGSRHQFSIAVVLISIIPLLALAYVIVNNLLRAGSIDVAGMKTLIGVGVGVVITMCLGYIMLLKYPINIIRLKKYLHDIAEGEIPGDVTLIKDENDLADIERSMKRIIEQTEERIKTIKEQQDQLLDSERNRVMLESVGAACHHLAQPTTVIVSYLEMMKMQGVPDSMAPMIEECLTSAESMREIIGRLQDVAEYSTESYVEAEKKDGGEIRTRIIKI